MNCTDGSSTASDSVVISLASSTPTTPTTPQVSFASITGVPPLSGLCGSVSAGSTQYVYEINVLTNTNPSTTYVFDGVVFHSDQAGCDATYENPSIAGISTSGKTQYAPGESGSLTATFDTSAFSCGRVQYDMGLKPVGANGIAEGDYTGLFYGIVINYGVDCVSAPAPTPT
ncbi:hypothetical protein GW944_00130, partial [Candidatus Parcubacteria bacterium]|nr:hypothetical protein [Candidatus Parcubacteria bacterium]